MERKISQMTEEKFEALKVLADDLATSGGALEFSTEILNLNVRITKNQRMIKMGMINLDVTPMKRMEISFDMPKFQGMDYEEFYNLLKQMTKNVM